MRTALPHRLALVTGVTVLFVFLVGWSASAPAAIKKAPSAAKSLRTLVGQTIGLEVPYVSS